MGDIAGNDICGRPIFVLISEQEFKLNINNVYFFFECKLYINDLILSFNPVESLVLAPFCKEKN